MRRTLSVAVLGLLALASGRASAAPVHDICADLGSTLPVGVSSFSAAGDWPSVAASQYGVDWKLLYVYVVPTTDPKADVEYWLLGKADLAKSLGAIPVYTFYELLQIGQQNGMTGSEPDVVKAVLADPASMKRYFDDFVFLLQTAEKAGTPTIVHVEPDSWGFMMWAMGVEGNADATSIQVSVKSSGHPDVASFPDHAGGLGRALLALRDKYAPSVRLGWHASNFRVGQKPEVVTGFYSAMGEWDVLFTEQPHLEGDPKQWWLPWDATLLQTNEAWFQKLSGDTGLPILLWQAQIGTTDFHFFDGDSANLEAFANVGLGGVLFDLRGSGNPDDYRAYESKDLATVPPSSSTAGGTAKDMRARLAEYAKAPLAWPVGSPCASGGSSGGSGGGGGGGAGTGGTTQAVPNPPEKPQSDDSGCGCRAAGGRNPSGFGLLLMLAGLLASRRRGSASMLTR